MQAKIEDISAQHEAFLREEKERSARALREQSDQLRAQLELQLRAKEETLQRVREQGFEAQQSLMRQQEKFEI